MQISLNSVCLTSHDSCFSYLCTFFDTLTTLFYWSSEDWKPGDKIQMVSTEMKQRFVLNIYRRFKDGQSNARSKIIGLSFCFNNY